jgi:phage-related protein
MGTPIESVQQAYQGFAKGQYQLLDNLKLGYGGTKTEMERLLKDAQEISGVEYNIDNLGDVYDAIHVIQEDLGLTGVAADEAATTFSGSLGAMKAAAANVLGNLALGRDVGPSLKQLGATVKTFLVGNVLPMIANIAQQIPTFLAMLPSFIADMAPELIAGAANIVKNLATGIVNNIPTFIAGLGSLFSSLYSAFTNIDWGSVASNLLTGLQTAIGSIWDSVTALLEAEFGITMPDWETVVQNISDLWDQVKAGIGEFFKAAFDILMDDDMTIIEKISALWDLVKAGIGDFFKTAFEIALPVAQDIINAIDTWWSTNIWPSIQDFFKTTFGIEIPSWEDVKEAVSNFWDDFKKGIADFFKVTFNVELPSWEDIKESIKTGWDTVKKGVGNIFSWVFSLDFPDVDTIVQGLKDWWGKVVKGIGDFFTLKWIFDGDSGAEEANKFFTESNEHGDTVLAVR